MKRLFILLISAFCICALLVSCNQIKISNGSLSELDGVSMTIESVSYYDDRKEINVVFHNDTDYEVYFDSECDIKYRNGVEWESVKTATDLLDSMLYSIKPHSTYETSFSSEHYDLSKNGVYRLYSYLSIRGNESQNYSAYAEFEVTSVKSHRVTMKDEDWLFEDLKDRYYEGEKVTVKIGTVTDTGYLLLANGKNVKEVIPNSDGSYDYWEFEFTMPKEDVLLEFKTYDGFLQYPNEGRLIEAYILANPDIEGAWIDRYYGEYESGAIVAIIQSRNDAEEKLNTEMVRGFAYTYPNESTKISVYYNSSFYTLMEAYKNGYLTDDDLEDIYNQHKLIFDELYFDITYFPGFEGLDTDADKIVVNFDNYTADGFEFEITDKDEIKSILETILSSTIEYFGEAVAGKFTTQTLTVYDGDKIYTIKDVFILPNGYYFIKEKACRDRICELATELGAWDEIKRLNDVFNGTHYPYYIPDNADSITISKVVDCYELIDIVTVTKKGEISQILDILKRAEISNYDSPTNGEGLYISIEYSFKNGTGWSNIDSSFELRNRYFVVDIGELYDYISSTK